MNTSILSLVSFTLITQMCIGAFVLQELLIPYSHFDKPVVSRLKSRLLGALLVLIVLAVVLSFFHLGKPNHAIFFLDNLQSSWLSREILMLPVFAFLLFVYAIAFKKLRAHKAWLKILGILLIISGILLIFIMSKIYTLPTIPAWNLLATPAEFYNAGFLLGAMLVLIKMKGAVVHKEAVRAEFLSGRIRMLLVFVIVLIIADLLISFYDLYAIDGFAANIHLLLNLTKTFFHLISLFVLLALYRRFTAGGKTTALSGASLLMVLLIIAEIFGRYAFYVSFEGMGM